MADEFIHVDPAQKRADLPEFDQETCPKCGGHRVETGFGLAGGGYGVYAFCEDCQEVVSKSEVSD